jgi:16S rRNA (uracil1498-N3)-methyltransferase
LYCEQTLSARSTLVLSRDASHYLVTVLRLGDGATVRLFNAIDGEWQCEISQANRKAARVVCNDRLNDVKLPPDIDYLFAPLKSARLDYLTQKATEMGVRRLCPVITRYTIADKVNLDRMRANAIEAAEQCNMVYVPDVNEPEKLGHLLTNWPDNRTLIFCDERANQESPVDALKQVNPGPLGVLLGPEGGFSEEERDMILSVPNVVALSLGPRIMRADTAGVAVLALLQSVLGDWRDDK